jgi:hypothetical protein
MLLDKLWVRIKGEFLSLKEDVSAGEDLKEKAELLLKKLEQRLGLASGDSEPTESGSTKNSVLDRGMDRESLRDIERQWDELMQRKDRKQAKSQQETPTKPNPRTLG